MISALFDDTFEMDLYLLLLFYIIILYSVKLSWTDLLTETTLNPLTYGWILLIYDSTNDNVLSNCCSSFDNWLYCDCLYTLTLFNTNTFYKLGW